MAAKIQILSVNEVFSHLHSSESGLTDRDVRERLRQSGPNEHASGAPAWHLRNLARPVYAFSCAAALARCRARLHARLHATSPGAAHVGNRDCRGRCDQRSVCFRSGIQNGARIDGTAPLDAGSRCRNAARYNARCRSASIAPGDLIIIREGDRVPADARLVEPLRVTVSRCLIGRLQSSCSDELRGVGTNACSKSRRSRRSLYEALLNFGGQTAL